MSIWNNYSRFFNKSLKQPGYALGVFIKRLKAYFYYYFSNGKSSLPESITLFLTHRCNLHCVMCGQWGEGGVTRKQGLEYIQEELSQDELKSIIDGVSSFRPGVTLFGGEPLLYPFCIDIINYIKQKKMHCLMITNGSLLEEKAQAIVRSGLDELNVSLDGQRALHDRIRGSPGLFDRIISGLKQVQHFKEKLNTKKPLVNLQCTISRFNYMHLEEMLAVAEGIKADSLTYHNLIFLEKDLLEKQKSFDQALGCNSLNWEGFVFEPGIDARILYDKISLIISRKYPFNVDVYPKLSYKELIDYYGSSPRGTKKRCISPWVVAYIFPDGEVRPCLNFSYSYGNIKTEKFTDIWNNEKAAKYRGFLKKIKVFPVCLRCTELYRY